MFDIVKNKSKFFLILILIVASFLRLWSLNKVPVALFGDEVDVGYHAYSLLKTGKDYMGYSWPLHLHSYADIRTPLYTYAAIPTVYLYGISSLGVRLPAAIFGILGIWAIYLLSNQLVKKKFSPWNLKFGILPALVLALSPWHIQYSRGAFEVTMFLTFLLFGLYFFFRSLKSGRYLWISAVLIVLTPLIYHTAKLFAPMLLPVLIFIFGKEIFRLQKKYLIRALVAGLICGIPIVVSTFFGGGALRFNYISVFSDPTTVPEVDYARLVDAQVRGDSADIIPKIASRLVHNKVTYWMERIVSNAFNALSFDFLFVNGDANLRHSIKGVGQFYWIEVIPLILGLIYFFALHKDKKIKTLIGFWILAGVIPAAITRDGGNHATRLIIILPPLVILISYGILEGLNRINKNTRILLAASYILLFMVEFGFYQHYYWVHNPWYSERQWHAGYEQMVEGVKQLEVDFNKIVITDKYEPPKIFFAGFYPYPPQVWQKGFEKTKLLGFDYLERVDKFYFGHAGPISINDLSDYLDNKTLYVAFAAEVPVNLLREPGKAPTGLSLIRSVSFPSGEPAFYFFTKKEL